MILLDTHIWFWWVQDQARLNAEYRELIQRHETGGIGISVISCWEMALLIHRGRLKVSLSANEWVKRATEYPGVSFLPLTPAIAVESVTLPDLAHRDPADRFLIATARVLDLSLVTQDLTIRAYPHVETP